MAFTYTATDLVDWLKADLSYGNAWGFIIERLLKNKHTLEVEWLIGRHFDGEYGRAYVDTGARDRMQATEWAKDALRERAGTGVDVPGNYFPLIARDYAINGPGKGNTAKSLGTTLDFLILLSKFGSNHPSGDMLETNATLGKDVPEVFCYIYANKYSPGNFTQRTRAMVNIQGNEATKTKSAVGPPGLDPMYWDSGPGHEHEDQTHHFAAYFCFGASHGFHPNEIHTALSYSGDWSIWDQKVLDQGDYNLGFVGAKWGASFKKKPRFIGKEVEQALLTKDTAIHDPLPD
jgi:hypothetical protein